MRRVDVSYAQLGRPELIQLVKDSDAIMAVDVAFGHAKIYIRGVAKLEAEANGWSVDGSCLCVTVDSSNREFEGLLVVVEDIRG